MCIQFWMHIVGFNRKPMPDNLKFWVDLYACKPVNYKKRRWKIADKKNLTIQIKEDEHRKLKMKAAEQGLTIKQAILSALDKMFPGWRSETK